LVDVLKDIHVKHILSVCSIIASNKAVLVGLAFLYTNVNNARVVEKVFKNIYDKPKAVVGYDLFGLSPCLKSVYNK
jgi:hypothetical protein